jgi:hypothetical protein
MLSSLELQLLRLLGISAYLAWWNTLCGNPSPNQEDYQRRMNNPIPGDLVLETTTLARGSPPNNIGRLLSVVPEPYPDWDDEEEPVPTRDIWTIETLDGQRVRWENCHFIKIPEDAYAPIEKRKRELE